MLDVGSHKRNTLPKLSQLSQEPLPEGLVGDVCWIVDMRRQTIEYGIKFEQQVLCSIKVTELNLEFYRIAQRGSERDFFLNCSHPCFSALLQHAANLLSLSLWYSRKKLLPPDQLMHILEQDCVPDSRSYQF